LIAVLEVTKGEKRKKRKSKGKTDRFPAKRHFHTKRSRGGEGGEVGKRQGKGGNDLLLQTNAVPVTQKGDMG